MRVGRDGWQAADLDRAAEELAEMEAYTVEAKMFEWLGIEAEGYYHSLHTAWDRVREEFGDAATPVNPVPNYFAHVPIILELLVETAVLYRG